MDAGLFDLQDSLMTTIRKGHPANDNINNDNSHVDGDDCRDDCSDNSYF